MEVKRACPTCGSVWASIVQSEMSAHHAPKQEPLPADVGDLIEKLAIANCKLYALCDRKAELAKAEHPDAKEMQEVMAKDIELCKERARLKGLINQALGARGDSVKMYGRPT